MRKSQGSSLFLLIAAGLFVLNFLFKFLLYPDVSLWLDEAYSVFNAQKSIAEIIELCKVDQNPPFYLILLHFWIKLFGISEVGARSMTLLFSAATAPLLFLTVKRYWGVSIALCSTALFSFADMHFYYSMEARAFALVSFLCIASLNLYFKVFERGNYWLGLGIGVVNSMAFFSHYIAVFIPVTQLIVSLFFLRKNNALFFAVIIGGIVSIIPLIPWVGFIIEAMPEKGVYWLQPPGFGQLVGLFVSFFGSKIPLILFFVVGAVWLFFNRSKLLNFRALTDSEKFKWVLLLCWIVVPVFVDYLISFKTPVFLNRYLLYVSFPFYILSGVFVFGLPWNTNIKWGIVGVLILAFGLSINTSLSKDENWKEAINYLKQTRSKKDAVIASAWYTNMIFSYYYDKEFFKQYNNNVELLQSSNVHFFNSLNSENLQDIQPGERVFLVLCHWENVDPEHTITQVVETEYNLVKERNFEKVRVLEYQRK